MKRCGVSIAVEPTMMSRPVALATSCIVRSSEYARPPTTKTTRRGCSSAGSPGRLPLLGSPPGGGLVYGKSCAESAPASASSSILLSGGT